MLENLRPYIIPIILVIIGFGSLISSYLYPDFFEAMVIEDGPIENLTVLVLLLALLLTLYRLFSLWSKKKIIWRIMTIGLSLFLLFGFGEEISWGQRIFGWSSDGFFQENNTQGEINIHNLELWGIRLNFLISQVFTVLLSIYVLGGSYFYRKKENFRKFIDNAGIPIPSGFQIIWVIFPLALMLAISHSQKWEILEISLALAGFFILSSPINKKIIYT